MGAYSVTGVGQGAASSKSKGAERQTIGAEQLRGPKVVISGEITLTASDKQDVWPRLPGSVNDYALIWSSSSFGTTATMTMDSTATYLDFTGGNGTKINYMVIKTGFTKK